MLEEEMQESIDRHPYVYAWGKFCTSLEAWIKHELKQADLEQAPYLATFKTDGKWRTCEISNENRKALDTILEKYRLWASTELYPINRDNPLVTLYQYRNDIIGYSLRTDFKDWIEQTSLFNAIINDPIGMKIQAQDGTISLDLAKKIKKPEDLPVELIKEFYINSPFFQNTKEGTNQPQLEHGSERTS